MMDGETLQILLFLVIGGYGGGALAGLLGVGRARWGKVGGAIGFGVAALSSLLGCTVSAAVMLSGTTLDVNLPRVLPFGDLSLHLDSLSAFFLLVISIVGTFVSLYSPGYASSAAGSEKTGLLAFLYNLFLLSMAGVVIAGDAVLFLILWEVMSLTTFFLIVFEKESTASRRAGFLYVIMTHAGTAFLLVMFLLLFVSTGSFSFSALHGAGAGIPDPTKSIIFLCALIGFGTKAGLIPLHIWLPEAHPAAPSNVSALMSGVMIKTGIYGMVRVFFGFLGPGAEWWGILVLVLAVTSSVLGVLYALMEHDLKRLLAFHSIENIGIILMGIGAAMLFSASGNKVLASLALLAGLYHVLNHAIFKALLFMGAGAVVNATGTRNMEKLGGLVRRLPVTAGLFLVGSLAISALPPLNGFVSEWLTFQALLQGFSIASLPVKDRHTAYGRITGVDGGPGCRLLREGFWNYLPGTPSLRRGRHCPRTALDDARSDGRACRSLPSAWNCAGPRDEPAQPDGHAHGRGTGLSARGSRGGHPHGLQKPHGKHFPARTGGAGRTHNTAVHRSWGAAGKTAPHPHIVRLGLWNGKRHSPYAVHGHRFLEAVAAYLCKCLPGPSRNRGLRGLLSLFPVVYPL